MKFIALLGFGNKTGVAVSYDISVRVGKCFVSCDYFFSFFFPGGINGVIPCFSPSGFVSVISGLNPLGAV